MKRIRVAALQYYIRPVSSFQDFADQVGSLVETAADYDCHLLVFPEYFTAQLLTLNDTRKPIRAQIRDLATHVPPFIELMEGLAREHEIFVVAGTIPVKDEETGSVHNDSMVFSPSGALGVQGKLHMTRFEREEWDVSPRSVLKIFDTELGRFAVAVCYDVEFPEIARTAARQGADLLVVPSCTDDRLGFLRVRYCAQARAIENQMYVIHAATVGSLPMVPAVHLNWGQASILTPSDFSFARDGILAEGVPNQESRSFGTVLPLLDSERTRAIVESVTIEEL